MRFNAINNSLELDQFMLTFEEFFQKKKIDLTQLRNAEPGLFVEFSKHYPLMGEKSFDHTKKYWFNKLRRTYPLAVKAKSHPVEAAAISDMAIQGIAAAAAQNLDKNIAAAEIYRRSSGRTGCRKCFCKRSIAGGRRKRDFG